MQNFTLPKALPSPNSPISHLAVELLTQIWGNVPRASLAQILQVSQGWYTDAIAITYLWNYLVFGPQYSLNDLAVAQQWIARAQGLKLTVGITMTPECPQDHLIPIFHMLSSCSQKLRALFITAPDDTAGNVVHFLSENSFDWVQILSVMLESELNYSPYGRLPMGTTDTIHHLPFPRLAKLHCTNIPLIFPVIRRAPVHA
ncbi:hypothetical protein C8R43DRAFT_1123514 [Mycena crocata]|nr:hypothetical protein C8R43DRAFT_1123514 [Mycena crocata]